MSYKTYKLGVSDNRNVKGRSLFFFLFFFFKQKAAYEVCGRDWSSDVCSSDLAETWSTVPQTSENAVTVSTDLLEAPLTVEELGTTDRKSVV